MNVSANDRETPIHRKPTDLKAHKYRTEKLLSTPSVVQLQSAAPVREGEEGEEGEVPPNADIIGLMSSLADQIDNSLSRVNMLTLTPEQHHEYYAQKARRGGLDPDAASLASIFAAMDAARADSSGVEEQTTT